MTKIKNMANDMLDELEDAKKYAEYYIEQKAKNNSQWANRYKEMAQDELKHAMYIHDKIVAEIDELSKVYTPPVEMQDKWEHDHKKYIEQLGAVKVYLTM